MLQAQAQLLQVTRISTLHYPLNYLIKAQMTTPKKMTQNMTLMLLLKTKSINSKFKRSKMEGPKFSQVKKSNEQALSKLIQIAHILKKAIKMEINLMLLTAVT